MPEFEVTPSTIVNDGDTARKWMYEFSPRSEQAGVLAQIAQAEAGAGILAVLIEIKDTLKSFLSAVEDMPEGVEVARATGGPSLTHGDVEGVVQQGMKKPSSCNHGGPGERPIPERARGRARVHPARGIPHRQRG